MSNEFLLKKGSCPDRFEVLLHFCVSVIDSNTLLIEDSPECALMLATDVLEVEEVERSIG